MYLYEWLLTIFSRSLPLDVTHRIWDNFLCSGHTFLFRTALGLLRLQQTTFISCTFEEALQLLNRPPKDFDADQLFNEIAKISVTEDKLNKLMAQRERGS
jgi:Rab-GTPase-TBC domain